MVSACGLGPSAKSRALNREKGELQKLHYLMLFFKILGKGSQNDQLGMETPEVKEGDPA